MEINNKFNIGDEVFLYCGHGLKRGVVKNINIKVGEGLAGGYGVRYDINVNGEIFDRLDRDVYGTVGEALDELRRRYEASQGK